MRARDYPLDLARPLRRLGDAAGEALQRHVEGALLDAGEPRREPELLERLDTDADLVGRLADGVGGADGPIDESREAARRDDAGESPGEGADAEAQALDSLAEPNQTPRHP